MIPRLFLRALGVMLLLILAFLLAVKYKEHMAQEAAPYTSDSSNSP